MNFLRPIRGLIWLLAAAIAGLALVFLPTWLVSQYQAVRQLGSLWGTLYAIAVGAGLLLVAGSTLWILWTLWGRSLTKRLRRQRRDKSPSELSIVQREAEIDENLGSLQDLRRTAKNAPYDPEIDRIVGNLQQKRKQRTLELVAFGTISSGKSSVLNALAGHDLFPTDIRGGTTTRRSEVAWDRLDKVVLVDTPGLGEIDGSEHVRVAAESAKDADLILLVVDGPLRQSEFRLLEQLGQMEKRIVICLNKTDWYAADDRDKLLRQIASQTSAYTPPDNIVAIQAEATRRKRMRVLVDGSTVEESVDVPVDIASLAERMTTILRRDGLELLTANLLLQSRGILEKAKSQMQESIDRRAWGIVDRYMWGAGGAAAVIPFPVVDLFAGMGISTKMVLDLAEVYQQPVDLETARRWLGEMGKNLVGVLGVNLAAPAVASLVGSLIKSVPVAGTIAGGVLQGAVQALVTKWIGSVFIEYFRNEMQTPEGGLAGIARRKWEQLTTLDELRKIVQAARHPGSARASNPAPR